MLMKVKQMKKGISEFDKIYIAKYIEIIGKRQVAEDVHISQEKVEDVIQNLKRSGLYDIYKNLPDEEWERIERSSNEEVLRKYLPQVINSKAVFEEIFEIFNVDLLETIMKFPLYNCTYWNFKFDYFKNKDYKDEEWKQIEGLNYLVSNYGRIKNKTTKKLKTLRNNRFGYQINLWNNGKARMMTVSRLVAHYFIRPVKENERVRHIDGRIKNNYYRNLEIVSK